MLDQFEVVEESKSVFIQLLYKTTVRVIQGHLYFTAEGKHVIVKYHIKRRLVDIEEDFIKINFPSWLEQDTIANTIMKCLYHNIGLKVDAVRINIPKGHASLKFLYDNFEQDIYEW